MFPFSDHKMNHPLFSRHCDKARRVGILVAIRVYVVVLGLGIYIYDCTYTYVFTRKGAENYKSQRDRERVRSRSFVFGQELWLHLLTNEGDNAETDNYRDVPVVKPEGKIDRSGSFVDKNIELRCAEAAYPLSWSGAEDDYWRSRSGEDVKASDCPRRAAHQ
ncbi:hypothetical protein J6590_016325 [Homalodisca vitripennis]|nr:hypothetical protein J6590_016325 [Homalodisca vitripennis]